MASLIVGSDDCPAQLIRNILKGSEAFHIFFEKWPDFATSLGLNLERIKKLKQDSILNKMQLSEIVFDVIENWIGKEGSNATLQKILNALEDNKLGIIADSLRKEFYMGSCQFSVPCYYVQRAFTPGNILDKEKLLNFAFSSSDIFLFIGLTEIQLSKIIQICFAERYSFQDEDSITQRFFIFKDIKDFDKIRMPWNSIHLIHVDIHTDKWTHIKSNGNLTQLRDVIKLQGRLSEVELIKSREFRKMPNVPVCIVADSGSGKTTLLNYIGQTLAGFYKDRIVLWVNANNFLNQINVLKHQDQYSAFETFLFTEFCTNDFHKKCIAECLRSKVLKIELLLDEMNFPEEGNLVYEMLTLLSSLPSIRIWMTSPVNIAPHLENCLKVFSYKIKNFSEKDLLKYEFALQHSSFILPQYYINRMITSRNVICKDKLLQGLSSSADIFVFDGIIWPHISPSLSNQITENSTFTIQRLKLTQKYIILDDPDHFKEICEKSKPPVHLIHVDNLTDTWTHVKSNGNLETIQKLTNTTQTCFVEDKLTQFVKSTPIGTPICLSDSPGMGKSILLQHIGHNLETARKNRVVWLIGMDKFINTIKEEMTSIDDKDTAMEKTLYRLFCTDPLQKFTLCSKLKSSNVNIELLLDGLDEVNPENLQFAFEILAYLLNISSIRFWVTTRPHLLHQLETCLNTFGYNILPFTEQDQIQFLTKFWCSRAPTRLDEYAVVEFSKNCLSNLKLRLNSKDEDIVGIPLQCLLIGEVYEKQALEHSTTTQVKNSGILQIGSLIELYQFLVETKFEKYQSFGKAKKKLSLKEINLQHIRLAVQLIYPEIQNTLPTYIPKTVDLEELLNVGLLEKTSSDPKFIHRTIGEYFVGKFIAYMINHKEEKYFDRWSNFISKVVIPCKEIPCETYFDNLKSVCFINSEICYFLNLLIKEKESKQSLSFTPNEIINVVRGCAYGQMFNLFELFYNLCNLKSIFHIIFDRDFLYLTIRYSNIDFVELAVKHFKIEQLTKYEQTRLLCLAVLNGDVSILQYLLNIANLTGLIEAPVHLAKMIIHECVRNSLSNSEGEVNRKMEILCFILNINGNLLEEEDAFGRTPILCENIHHKLIKKLIELKTNVLAVDKNQNTLLHVHVKIIENFITSISNESVKTLVATPNNEGDTPLLTLLKSMDPTSEQLDMFKMYNCDLNWRNNEQYSALAIAVINGRNVETIRRLIRYGGNVWCKKGWRRKTLLHYAGQCGNLQVFNYLTREYSMKTLLKDWSWTTPIDYLIKYFVDNNKFDDVTKLYPDSIKELDTKTKEEFVAKTVENLNETALNYLLDNGVDLGKISHVNANAESDALFVLAENFKPEPGLRMLRRLITSGANVHLRNNLNETFLHVLLAKGSGLGRDEFHKLVEILVETKTVNLIMEQGGPGGNTPMHVAMKMFEISEATVKLLARVIN